MTTVALVSGGGRREMSIAMILWKNWCPALHYEKNFLLWMPVPSTGNSKLLGSPFFWSHGQGLPFLDVLFRRRLPHLQTGLVRQKVAPQCSDGLSMHSNLTHATKPRRAITINQYQNKEKEMSTASRQSKLLPHMSSEWRSCDLIVATQGKITAGLWKFMVRNVLYSWLSGGYFRTYKSRAIPQIGFLR